MLKNFRGNPAYLLGYHLKFGLSLLALNVGLFVTSPPHLMDLILFLPAILILTTPNLKSILGVFFTYSTYCFLRDDFSWLNVGLMIPVMALSLTFSALIHCASHDSIKPSWLNRAIGELMGLIQLSSLPEWKIIHVLHHKFADDPVRDPHPPLNKGFWEFVFGMRASIGLCFQNLFLQYFPMSPEIKKTLIRTRYASQFNSFMKVMFWFLVLKPQLFILGFVFSIAFKMIHFAWFNYSTHRPKESGVQIQNLTKSTYKILNFFAIGLYYHDNHHKAPNLFNPKYYEPELKNENQSRIA